MFGLAMCCGTVATMIGLGYLMQRRGYKGGRAFYLSGLGVSSLLVFTGAALSLTMHPAFAEATAAPLGTGSAALGLVGEKPEMLGTTLIYLGLSEGIAIYGVIVSLLILGRI